MYEELTKCRNFKGHLPEKLSNRPNFCDTCPKTLKDVWILHDNCPKNTDSGCSCFLLFSGRLSRERTVLHCWPQQLWDSEQSSLTSAGLYPPCILYCPAMPTLSSYIHHESKNTHARRLLSISSLIIDRFLARDSMLSAPYAIARPSVCLSVRPSVCHTGGSVENGWSYDHAIFTIQ